MRKPLGLGLAALSMTAAFGGAAAAAAQQSRSDGRPRVACEFLFRSSRWFTG